jgi:hypothetical protein
MFQGVHDRKPGDAGELRERPHGDVDLHATSHVATVPLDREQQRDVHRLTIKGVSAAPFLNIRSLKKVEHLSRGARAGVSAFLRPAWLQSQALHCSTLEKTFLGVRQKGPKKWPRGRCAVHQGCATIWLPLPGKGRGRTPHSYPRPLFTELPTTAFSEVRAPNKGHKVTPPASVGDGTCLDGGVSLFP